MSSIDLIITDQPNLNVDSLVDPSLNECYQHKIIHGNLNISVASSLFKRKVWDYSEANVEEIRNTIMPMDWKSKLSDPDPENMSNISQKRYYSYLQTCWGYEQLSCEPQGIPQKGLQITCALTIYLNDVI